LYFTEALWPEFDEAELNKALHWYASRERRFGKVTHTQVKETA
jgi:undecaprenyl diphosphate synthase